MTARAFLGAGDLYIAQYVGGTFTEYEGPFECSKFQIKPNVDLKEQTSKGRDTYGQVIETVALQKPADLTIDLTEVNKNTLAIALLGTTSALGQTAGTLTDEAIAAKLGKWAQLSKQNFAATGQTVKNTAGAVTYVEGVDYLFNRRLGMIKALVGGAITEAQSVKVSGGYLAISGTQVSGATQSQLRARFKLDGKNFADDQSVIVTVHEAVIAADAAFDFLSSDFATVTMPGRMKTPAGYLEPFTVALRD